MWTDGRARAVNLIERNMMKVTDLYNKIVGFIHNLCNQEDMDVEEWAAQQKVINKGLSELLRMKGRSDMEEAEICVTALMGYTVALRERTAVSRMVARALAVLPKLGPVFLKCQLLVYLYGETLDEDLAQQAKVIMAGWPEATRTTSQRELVMLLDDLEEDAGFYEITED